MYLSKSAKRNILIGLIVILVAGAIGVFVLLQKPKVTMATISGSGYINSTLEARYEPTEATVTYQWKVGTSATGPFVEISGATASTLDVTVGDVGKYFQVVITGTGEYEGVKQSVGFGPIVGVTMTWPDASAITYGNALSASTLGEGRAVINGVNVPGSFAFVNPDLIPDTAGQIEADVVFTPTDLTKYQPITSKVNVPVNKALLTVTVANQSIVYGGFVSEYQYTISGFLLDDDASVVSGKPNLHSIYSPGMAVKYSPIQILGEIGSLKSTNYDFAFVFGELSITKKTLTISGLTGKDKTYDGSTKASVSGTARLNGIFMNDSVSLSGKPVFRFSSVGPANNIPIKVTGYALKGTAAANYTLVMPTLRADILPLEE